MSPIRVLIVEDVASDAELVERELKAAGIKFCARCVADRGTFLKALEEFSPGIIISDFSLPGFDAMMALELVRSRDPEIPFLLVTGSQSEQVAVDCMRKGVDDYILKSSLKRLPAAVLNVVAKRAAEAEKNRAITALRRSEEYFRGLIENALDIITVLGADGTIRFASPSVRKALGYAPEELVGRNWLEWVHPDHRGAVGEAVRRAASEPDYAPTIQLLFRHRNGSWCMLEAIGKSFPDREGDAAVVLNAREVGERQRAAAEIEKLAAFPRMNPNPVLEFGDDGSLTYFNQAAERMAQSLGRRHPVEILPPDAAILVLECLASGRSELRRETTIGERIISWSFFPIRASRVVHCYAEDMTERMTLEAQLRQSQKLESIGQLASGVAHDFNNLLTIIQGYTSLLMTEANLQAPMGDSLRQIGGAAERAANLTRQLLMFSRKQVMQPRELNLNEVTANLARLLRRILGEDVSLHFNYAPKLPLIHADSGMVEQIVMNLAVNARDAMPRGGALHISTLTTEMDSRTMKPNIEAQPGTYVCLQVTDTGSGIPPDVLPRIFEPFFTTKEIGKGTGLGLATIYGIVKQHKGWIDVFSRVGEGTTFKVFLPGLPASSSPSVAGVKQAADDVVGGRELVLVVEDEDELRGLVREVLQRYGYRVIEAGSGPEALRVWEENRKEIQLLLTDMVMPGNMSGRELAETLRARQPRLKVIFTSGYSVDVVDKDFGLQPGLFFLQKPYPPPALARMVRDCLDGVEA